MISVHLSAFLDFVNTFIRYRPNQNLFLQNKNLNRFRKCLLKAYILQTFKIRYKFFSSCSLTYLNNIWFAPVLVCFALWSLLVKPAGNTPQIQQWNAGKRYGIFSKLIVKTLERRQRFLMSLCQWGRSGVFFC